MSSVQRSVILCVSVVSVFAAVSPQRHRAKQRSHRENTEACRSLSRSCRVGKISHVPKRRFTIRKIRAIVKGRAVVLLHPTFLHSEFIQRGHSTYPFRFTNAA